MKLFIDKIKLLFILSSLAMILSSCAGGPKTNVLGEKFQQNKKSHYVQVMKDDKYIYNGIDSDSLSNNKSNGSIEDKYPIFILSGGLNSISSAYAQNICNKLNSYPLNNKYLCLFYPITKADQYSVLMRPTLPINKDDNNIVWADFIITNTTDILDKQLYNKGPLANYPKLDVVMFLNGEYLYVLGDIKYNSLGLKSFFDNFTKQNSLQVLNVGYYNDKSKDFLQKIIQANKWNIKLNFVDMKKDNKQNQNLDLLIDFGINVSSNLQNFLNKNRNHYIPLNLDINTIKNTQILNKDLSYANIVNYYTYDQLANIVKMVNVSDDVNIKNNNSNMGNKITSNYNKKMPPFVNSSKYPNDFDSKVFGKSAFDFNLRSVDDILKKDKLASVDNIVINTIGIRNVLAASRATDPEKVSIIISAFLDGFDMYKNNLPTVDMEYYNIPDLLLANLYKNNLVYHYGVMNYNQFLNDKSITLSDAQNIIVTTISNNLTANNFPKKFGPSLANDKEMQYINMQVMNNKLISQQNRIINKFSYFINSIKNELEKDNNNSFDMVKVYTKINNDSEVNINPMNFSYDIYNNISIK